MPYACGLPEYFFFNSFSLFVCLFVHLLLSIMKTRNKTVEMVAYHRLHDVLHELQPVCVIDTIHSYTIILHWFCASLLRAENRIATLTHSHAYTHTKSVFVAKSRVVGEEHVTIMACPFCSKFVLIHMI